MQDIVKYDVTDAAIAEMKSQYMGLMVKDFNDDRGIAEVHRARMIVKGKRVEVEKRRKELKADALAWGQKVDSEAKRIFGLLAPIEQHLESEENKVAQEKERRKVEAERKAQETAQARVNAMAKVGIILPFLHAKEMPDNDFSAMLLEATEAYEAEQDRLANEKRIADEKSAAEKKAREAEAAKLAEERAEFERVQAEELKKRQAEYIRIKAENDKLEADRRALELAIREQEVKASIEQAKKDAAEKALKDAADRAQREAAEKVEAERLAKAEADRQEALRPDREKLIAYADALMSNIDPVLKSDEAKNIFSSAYKRLLAVNRYIIKAAMEL